MDCFASLAMSAALAGCEFTVIAAFAARENKTPAALGDRGLWTERVAIKNR
jgi:hypothetical protein